MRSEAACLGEISLNFADIPPRRDENFPYKHVQVGQPGKARRDRVFFNWLSFIFQMLIKKIKTFVLHNGFTSLLIVKTT